jgi:hypothetical protein
MGNLFISFTIAIGSAIGLVSLSRALDLEFYTNKILPLVPILYAIVYEVLEHRKADSTKARAGTLTKETVKAASLRAEAGITAGRIITDVAVSFVIKLSLEIFLVVLFLRYGNLAFGEVYGRFGIETVGTFLRGEHPWLAGQQGIYLLALVAVATCIVTGSWIGHTSKGNAILEGVLAGAAVTLVNSMTNMLHLYRTMEDATVRLADSMGYAMRAGFLVVIGLQVLLYGLWSGLVQMHRQERDEMKKAGKRPRK